MANETKQASLVIGANTEGAVSGINNLSVAMTELARNAKKAGTDASGAFSGSDKSLKVWKNRLDAINVSAIAGEDALSRLQAKAIMKGVDLSPLQQQIDIVRNNIALRDKLIARQKEEAAQAKNTASAYAALQKQIDSANARALSGQQAQSAGYFRNTASVSGIALTQKTDEDLKRLDLLNANNRKAEESLREAKRLETQARNVETSIRNMAQSFATAGMTASQAFEYKIKQQGLNLAQFQPALNELKAAEQQFAKVNGKAKEGDQFFQKYGMSAKQYAASLRGVPAQITDIVVSLQGGQRPLTVLLQQGGQLKDMFGGVLPAAKALTSQLLTMINPLTALAAGIGVVGYAIYEGMDESEKFAKALISSGNAAGMTRDEMNALAQRVGDLSGDYSTAITTVERFVSSGQAGSELITRATEGMSNAMRVTGQTADELSKSILKLAEDPKSAVKALNEQYNFLTIDIYKQIAALQKQGKYQEAADLAAKSFFDEMDRRAPAAAEQTGYIAAGWRSVSSTIKDAWNAMLDFGRAETNREKLKQAQDRLDSAIRSVKLGAWSGAEDERKAAQEALDRINEEIRLESKNAAEKKKSAEETKRQIKLLDEADKKKTKADPEKSYYQSTYETITRQIEQLKLEAQQEGALTNAQKLRIQIENQAADSKKKLTAAHKEYLNKQLDELEVLERAASDRKFVKDYEKQYRDELDKTVRSYEDQIAVVGMSPEKAEMYRKELEIMRDAYNRIEDAEKKGILPEGYDTKILEDARKQIDLIKQANQELKDVRNDPWLALTESLETYKESAQDAGTQIRDFAKNTFQSMEDAFVKFATTGKISFSDLVNSILADIARMYAKKATASLFDALFQLGGQTIASGLGSIFSSGSSSGSTASTGVGFKYNSSKFASGLEFRASGGPVTGKASYIVGEQGPELFVPNTSGTIIPNNQLGTTGGFNIQISHRNEGTAQQVSDTSADFDGKNLIIKIVTQDIQNDGMISRTMSKTFGMRRAAGAM